VLILISSILGSTQYNVIQIIIELIIIAILTYHLFHFNISSFELILIFTYVITSIISFLFNDISTFLLSAKLSGLTILSVLYATKTRINTNSILRLLQIIYFLNCILVFYEVISGKPWVSASLVGGFYSAYIGARPIGLFLTPHLSSVYVAIYLIYLFESPNTTFVYLQSFIGLLSMYFMELGTAFYALLIWYFYARSSKIPLLKTVLTPYTISIIIVCIAFFVNHYLEEIIKIFEATPGHRIYSLYIILPQLITMENFSSFTNLIPQNITEFTNITDNEVGLFELFIDNGFFLGILLLIMMIKYIDIYMIFIFSTLMHYSQFFDNSFIVISAVIFNKELIYLKNIKPKYFIKTKLSF
jgi:hypothetical protein